MSTATDALHALHDAGFPASQLAVGEAVGFAESGWNPHAVAHESDGSTSYGVWQINSSHGFPELANGAWEAVATNAVLAKRVYDSQGWNAWSTHKPTDPIGYARYTAALPPAIALVTAIYGAEAGGASAAGAGGSLGSSATGTVSDVGSGVTSLIKEPLALLHWLEEPVTWQRIAKVAIGGVIMSAALIILARKPLVSVGKAGVKAGKDAGAAAALA